MKTVLVGIARMGSTRLKGKVMMDLGGSPVLDWVVSAGLCASGIDDVVIATTTDPGDDVIEAWCKDHLVSCYRGSEDDVLERFYGAAVWMKADVAVRVTCDCPLLDSGVIEQVVALRQATLADYCSNIDPPTWPDGLDCEAIDVETLGHAYDEATSKIDRECVTTWIQRNRHRFTTETLVCPLPGMHKERWVLDTEDDFEFCREVVGGALDFSWIGIKTFLDKNPDLRKINAHHPRNERYYAALAKEPLEPRSYATSQKLLARAEAVIPLGAQTYSKSKIQYPAESPLFITHGDGGYCFDVDGNRYVDLVSGLLPVILGHRDPDVDYAIRRQQNLGSCFSLSTELEVELSELLCRLIPCAEMVRLGKNGTDVTSAAVRLARAHTGRDLILSSGYHGWADWAVAQDPVRNLGVPPASHVLPLKIGESLISYGFDFRKIAAVIVEPETNPEWLRLLRAECDKTGVLLIFDEVITGFRFGLGGAQELYGVTPDLACFGKAMANGSPISALVGKREYMKTMEKTSFSGTFFGDPVAIAAALATIKKLEREDVLTTIKKRQIDLLNLCLTDAPLGSPISFGGHLEALPRLQFADNDIKTLFIQEMAQQGVLIIASHNLSYAHDENCLIRVATAYSKVLPMLTEAVNTGTVKERIKGRSIPTWANVRATA